MKRIYTLHDPMLAGHLEAVLSDHSIACLIKNRHLMGGVGDLPPLEAWPEIWVINDGDTDRARALISSMLDSEPNEGPAWTCSDCGEAIEPQFSECWLCAGKDRSFPP